MARDVLIIDRMLGPAMSKTSFKRAVGTILRGQVAEFMEETISVREGSVMGWNQFNSDEQARETAMSRVEGEMLILMSSTLLMKIFKNSSHLIGGTSKLVLGAGQITELMVLNRTLGL